MLSKDQRIGLHVIADGADSGPKRRQIDLGIGGFVIDIQTDLDDDDIGLAQNARVGDGDEVAGNPRRLGSANKRSIGRREGKCALIEGCRPLTTARGRQIDADDLVQRIACTIARRGDRDGVGGTDKAETLHADNLAAAFVAQECLVAAAVQNRV